MKKQADLVIAPELNSWWDCTNVYHAEVCGREWINDLSVPVSGRWKLHAHKKSLSRHK